MRKIKTVLRLHHQSRFSRRAIAASQKISYGTVDNYIRRAAAAGIKWPLPPGIGERELAQLLFPSQPPDHRGGFHEPEFFHVQTELKSPGMTKLLAWEEYRQCHPEDGYSYSQFCHRYRVWLGRQKRSMRQTHLAGDKCFVDYCGPTIPIVSPHTGEYVQAQIFVAVLGASNYTFAHASVSQKEADWINSHINAAEFFGGWTALTIPDNLKSGVIKAHRYTPTLNASYEQWADHYGTALVPARPHRPKDKSKVENAVLVVERWIMARLRNHMFFSLGQLNAAIAELLIDLNNRPFKKLPGCRRTLFEQIDQPALRALPQHAYVYQHVRLARVHIDYHIEYDKHYYSVPHSLVKMQVEVRACSAMVNVYFNGNRIASHVRSHLQGQHTTLTEHMPKQHQAMSKFSAEYFSQWASDIGSSTAHIVQIQLNKKRHPEQAYRSVMALLSLAKQYDRVRLERACERAIQIGSPTRTSVKSILKNGLDKIEKTGTTDDMFNEDEHLLSHDNIRGSEYFH